MAVSAADRSRYLEAMIPDRFLLVAAGLAGAGGVALSAVAAHSGGDNLDTAARFLLLHAPALLALSILAGARPARLAAYGLLLGLVLFCGDLIARHVLGAALAPYAAPAGGFLMIAGWLGMAAAGLFGRRP